MTRNPEIPALRIQVEGFVKQSLRKLDAVNKTHGVAKSIALGLIDL